MDRVTSARIVAIVLTLAGAGAGSVLRGHVVEPRESVRLEGTPYRLAEYRGVDLPVSEGVLSALGSDSLLLREYQEPGDRPVWVLVDYHRAQKIGAQVHSPLTCYPGSGWTVTAREDAVLDGDSRPRPVRWLELQRGEERMLAAYWYETRWGRSSREMALKLGLVRSVLARRASDAAVVRVSTPVEAGDVSAARERLLRFLEIGGPRLEAELPFLAAS